METRHSSVDEETRSNIAGKPYLTLLEAYQSSVKIAVLANRSWVCWWVSCNGIDRGNRRAGHG